MAGSSSTIRRSAIAPSIGDTFERDFTGVALTFEPGETFERGGESPGALRQLWPWLHEFRATLTFAALCGLLLVLPLVALPLLLALFVDHVLIGRQAEWGAAVVLGMAAAGV